MKTQSQRFIEELKDITALSLAMIARPAITSSLARPTRFERHTWEPSLKLRSEAAESERENSVRTRVPRARRARAINPAHCGAAQACRGSDAEVSREQIQTAAQQSGAIVLFNSNRIWHLETVMQDGMRFTRRQVLA
jgi:hypothetical protein